MCWSRAATTRSRPRPARPKSVLRAAASWRSRSRTIARPPHFSTGSAADAMTKQRTDAVAPAHATDQHDEAVAPARATNQHDEADPPVRSVVELDAARFDATIAGCP